MKKPLKPDPDGLIGMWGHTINDEGAIIWQFQIIRRSEDLYICQLYSWMDCGPTECKPISRAIILGDGVKLYATDTLMNEAAEKYHDRLRHERDQQRWKTTSGDDFAPPNCNAQILPRPTPHP